MTADWNWSWVCAAPAAFFSKRQRAFRNAAVCHLRRWLNWRASNHSSLMNTPSMTHALFMREKVGVGSRSFPLCSSGVTGSEWWRFASYFVRTKTHRAPTFTAWRPLQPPVKPTARYSPCHSPFLCRCSLGLRTATWALGERGPSLPSCRCARRCQILSGKGPGHRPCCCFSPAGWGHSRLQNIASYKVCCSKVFNF